MSYDFNVDINFDNLRKAFDDLNNYEIAFEVGLQKGIARFKERLLQKLRENLTKYGLGDSKIASNIEIIDIEDGFIVRVGGASSEYAMFVEYGSGIVGLDGEPHPKLPSGWIHDSNGNGDEGWWYPTTASDPNKYKYKTKNGDYLAWTRGQEARPFMYDTWLWGRQSFHNMIGKDIRDEMKKVVG